MAAAQEAGPGGQGVPPRSDDRLQGDEKTMAGLAHVAILFLGIILPLIFWLMDKDKPNRSKYYIFQLKQALFWQIGAVVLSATCIGIPVALIMVVFGVIGAIKCFQGEPFEYPLVAQWAKD